MPAFDESFAAIEIALGERYGQPSSAAEAGLDSFTAAVAVILGRAVETKKVAKGLSALMEAGLLEPEAMAESDPTEIIDALKEFGVSVPVRVVGPIRRLAAWHVSRHERSPDPLRDPAISTGELREELSGLSGIGQATADAILLLAGGRGIYPLDRPTYRILIRHGWLDSTAEYDEARSVMERPAHEDPKTLTRLSAWFAQVGRDYCKVSVAKCARCPLQPFLPEGGPQEP